MSDRPVVSSLPFIMRVVEVITSIVAFAVVVEYTGSSEYNYIVFTGVSGFVVALAFMACYAARVQAVRGKVSAVVDGVWWVFWLAAAAVATNLLTGRFTDNSRTRASCAFCWITWACWTVSFITAIREARGYEY
ncbi:hypothetical protein D9Q98_007421 [Chlorella vulgaris]|uniref:MARVEL domain-containing protein n=1 Tax=Chlorella vulgaris TaxID=3077 RepID=A0A9D4TLD0_CHLVU|nr:hypothetical protein D9Q98_007421 [Chlorella vulgaris]